MPRLTDDRVVEIAKWIDKDRCNWDIKHETGESLGSIQSVRDGKYQRVIGNVGKFKC